MTIAALEPVEIVGSYIGRRRVPELDKKSFCRALVFLAAAPMAAMLGFGSIAPAATVFGKATFFICMTMFFASAIASFAVQEPRA